MRTIDGVTWHDYEENLEEKLTDLHARIHRGSYHPLPPRRKYIAKPDGRQRPLGVTALEDKIVRRAVVEVLNAIYEQDFLGFSFGFRPRRGQHDALDALAFGITQRNVNWLLDADIAAFFDTVSHEWTLRFLEHRIGDRRLLRLIEGSNVLVYSDRVRTGVHGWSGARSPRHRRVASSALYKSTGGGAAMTPPSAMQNQVTSFGTRATGRNVEA